MAWLTSSNSANGTLGVSRRNNMRKRKETWRRRENDIRATHRIALAYQHQKRKCGRKNGVTSSCRLGVWHQITCGEWATPSAAAYQEGAKKQAAVASGAYIAFLARRRSSIPLA